MKDKLKELYSGFRERLKSPFIITFIIVWTIKHWKLVYLVFNFGSSYNAEQRLSIIITQIGDETNIELFWIPLGLALCSFLGYLAISWLYELINTTYNLWARTLIYYWFDKRKIVEKTLYDDLNKDYSKLNADFKTIENDLFDLESDYDALKDEKLSIQSQLKEAQDEKLKLELLFQPLEDIKKKYDKLINDRDAFIQNGARKVIFQLLHHIYYKEVKASKKIQPEEVFLGSWTKLVFKNPELSVREHDSVIRYDSSTLLDSSGSYLGKMLEVFKVDDSDIFEINYENKENKNYVELLLKIDDSTYIGFTGTKKTDIPFPDDTLYDVSKLIQYSKVK